MTNTGYLFWFYLRDAIRNLFAAKLRAFLALLGILVGAGAVVALLSVSRLATEHALEAVRALGSHWLEVSLQASNRTGSGRAELTPEEWSSVFASIPHLEYPTPMKMEYAPVSMGNTNENNILMAVEPTAMSLLHLNVSAGRPMTTWDRRMPYVWLGAELAHSLSPWASGQLIGKIIKIGGAFYTITGILQPVSLVSILYGDLNHGVLLPLQSSQGAMHVSLQTDHALMGLSSHADTEQVKFAWQQAVHTLRPTAEVIFRDSADLVAVVHQEEETLSWLLGSIAGIALLVGGIGVMNILLVSVLERRREIGIRMAIGAEPLDIGYLFLVEAVLLTTVGGALGVVVGLMIAYGLALSSGWTFTLCSSEIFLGLLISIGVGLLAGGYPALRAARLSPAEILSV